jgi:D-glycero-D-manno-heptose 1,7-bisphosphate phosphatase
LIACSGLVILDRDGVLNSVVIDSEQGTVDSPLHPDQVSMLPQVGSSVRRLNEAGYQVAIATNQPSAAKGKTTRENLQAVHGKILSLIEAEGGKIAGSYICYHRSEDGCLCRKPKPGLLDEALRAHLSAGSSKSSVWMVGDGVTDVEAGVKAGVRTAFLAPRKCDACHVLEDRSLAPSFWGKSLAEFVDFLLSSKK